MICRRLVAFLILSVITAEVHADSLTLMARLDQATTSERGVSATLRKEIEDEAFRNPILCLELIRRLASGQIDDWRAVRPLFADEEFVCNQRYIEALRVILRTSMLEPPMIEQIPDSQFMENPDLVAEILAGDDRGNIAELLQRAVDSPEHFVPMTGEFIKLLRTSDWSQDRCGVTHGMSQDVLGLTVRVLLGVRNQENDTSVQRALHEALSLMKENPADECSWDIEMVQDAVRIELQKPISGSK